MLSLALTTVHRSTLPLSFGNLSSLVWLDVTGNKFDETKLPSNVTGVVAKFEDGKRCAKGVC